MKVLPFEFVLAMNTLVSIPLAFVGLACAHKSMWEGDGKGKENIQFELLQGEEERKRKPKVEPFAWESYKLGDSAWVQNEHMDDHEDFVEGER